MKRLFVLVLAAMMLCVGMAQAAEWREGLGPSKPYMGAVEADLSTLLGYMMFYPNAEDPRLQAQNFCQTLHIYLPRTDVMAGPGTLSLFTEAGKQVWSTAMDDAEAIIQRLMREDELEALIWGDGTCFDICLPKSLELNQGYYVNLAEGCILNEEGTLGNTVIDGKENWSFRVEGDYGVNALEYRTPQEDGSYVNVEKLPAHAGDEIRFDFVIGGEATHAYIYSMNNSVDFLVQLYEESCEVIGTVTQDNPSWGVLFMNADEETVDRIEFN